MTDDELKLAMTEKQALADISEQMKIMKQALRNAQAIADKHGLSFRASLDLPEGSKFKRRYDGDYSPATVSGEYYGKGSDDEYYEPEVDNDPDTKQIEEGYWGWLNSSLNC